MTVKRERSVAATIATLCLLVGGCSGVPRLTPYSMQEPYERIFDAPIVVVGVFLSDTPVRQPVRSQRNDGYPMQLRKITVRLENVLRGNLEHGTVAVYYFACAGAYDGPIPLGSWRSGDRRIVWLRRDSAVLRTACDGPDSCKMPVRSGAHPHYNSDPKKTLGYALADIWFTRGEGTNDAEFARGVDWGAPSTVPRAYLFEKLQRLAETEVPIVRVAACKQLSYFQQKCVETGAMP